MPTKGRKGSFELGRRTGDRITTVKMLHTLGVFYTRANDLDAARWRLEECLLLAGELHDEFSLRLAYGNLGLVETRLSAYESAYDNIIKELSGANRVGDEPTAVYAILGVAYQRGRSLTLAEATGLALAMQSTS